MFEDFDAEFIDFVEKFTDITSGRESQKVAQDG